MLRGFGLVVLALTLTACPDPNKKSKVDELVSAAKVTSADPVPTERKPEFKAMPSMTVDNLGAYIGGFRASELSTEKGRLKLDEICKALPINDSQVSLTVIKKAKMQDVVETVRGLGRAGAPKVLNKTDARDELGTELLVTPVSQLKGEPNPCSVCAMVNDKADTGVWNFKGGMGTRHRKGFAGPDLSGTADAMEKNLARCDSDTAFFTAAYNMPWEHGFAMGALLKKRDTDGKLSHLVLMGDEAVAGRPVKLAK